MTLFTRLTNTANNSTLPIIPNYDTSLGGDSRVTQWWDFNVGRVSLNANNRIQRVSARKSGGVDLVQAVDAKMPNLITSAATYNNKPVAFFDQLASVDVLLPETNTIFPVANNFSMVFIMESANVASTIFIGGGSSANDGMHAIASSVSAGTQQFQMRVGTANTLARAAVSITAPKDTPNLLIFTWEKATGTAGASFNGLPFATNIVANAVATDTGFSVGSGSTGNVPTKWGAVLLINESLRTGNDDLLGIVKQYAGTFGITVV